eukprot:TRINITY_DN16076_c0_g2_i1.p1 TRINITY_DN16076_c0_g2~~TRINITY_DN16076_c0_g2_i1.p1  ORF type:complete len:500 (-),score=132.83 TRINITY_DN16076_c0_g2_i1:338-1687(-)
MQSELDFLPPEDLYDDIRQGYHSFITESLENYNKVPILVAVHAFQDSLKYGIHLESETLENLAILFGRHGRMKDLLEVVQVMQDRGMLQDKVQKKVYGALLGATIHDLNSHRLEKRESVRPQAQDELLYYLNVAAMIRSKEVEPAYNLQCQEEVFYRNDKFVDELFYFMLFYGYLKTGDVHHAEDFYREIKDKGMHPDELISMSLVRTFVQSGYRMKAKKMLEKLASHEETAAMVDSVTCTILVDAFIDHQKASHAHDVLRLMIGLGLRPEVTSCCRLMSLFVHDEHPERALAWLEVMGENNINPEYAVCVQLIEGFSSQGHWDSAKKVIEIMSKMEMHPDLHCYSQLIHDLCETYMFAPALEFLEEMIEKNIKPDIVSCNLLLMVGCFQCEMEGVLKALKLMEKAGVDLSKIPCLRLIDGMVNRSTGSLESLPKVVQLCQDEIEVRKS